MSTGAVSSDATSVFSPPSTSGALSGSANSTVGAQDGSDGTQGQDNAGTNIADDSAPEGGEVSTSIGEGDGTAETVGFSVAGPVVSTVIPNRGTVSSSIVLRGINFGHSQGNARVVFGDVAAAITSWTDTEIVFVVPDVLPGPVDVSVVADTGTAEPVPFTVVLPSMAYVALRNHLDGGNNSIAALRIDEAAGADHGGGRISLSFRGNNAAGPWVHLFYRPS